MLFGMVSGVSRGTGVLDGVHVAKGKGQFWGGELAPTIFNGIFVNRNVFDSCVKS